ncbi:MAG: RNHCP domain-containing protein [Ktedonobacterales bacterium]
MARRDQPRQPGHSVRGQPRDKADRRPRHDERRPRAQPTPPQQHGESFTCGYCGQRIGPLPSGGRNRNHCPFCLYSRHVDAERSGDRASPCKGMMEPIGVFERPNGEEVIVHRCLVCGFERFNRVGADDDEAQVAELPRIAPRSAGQPQP